MQFFLAKSDPKEYSILDLARDGETDWTGVRNAQAQQAIRAMKPGDCVICYHSQGEASVVGWGYVEGEIWPDPENPKFSVFLYRYGGSLAKPVSLTQIKESGLFQDFALVRQSRLSTMAAPQAFVAWLKKQAKDFRP